jgi:hypothetical protein
MYRTLQNTGLNLGDCELWNYNIIITCVSVGTFTYDAGPVTYYDFPQTDEPVYLLGNCYSVLYGNSFN